ncbi:MAG: phosphoglycerate mutase family protein [Candidatus Doudnabacteria bacterium]|nr:phosphoglycerate mutase family protein [Candidatus Doudnabacteria bacterium]
MLKPTKNQNNQPVYWHCDCGKTNVKGRQKITVIAMRHGESEHNIAGVVNGNPKKIFHLTPKGKQQALRLAGKLKNKKMVAIIASEMLRTQETAAPLAKIKDIRIQVDKRINDIYAGRLEGIPIGEFRKLTNNIKKSVKGSETNADVGKRLKSFFEELMDCYAGQTVAIVSSEIILHALWQVSQGLPCDEDFGEHLYNGIAYKFVMRSPICCPSCGDRCAI